MTSKKHKENRDGCIARAMLTWLRHRNTGSNPIWIKRLSPKDWAQVQYNTETGSTQENEIERVLDRAFPSPDNKL